MLVESMNLHDDFDISILVIPISAYPTISSTTIIIATIPPPIGPLRQRLNHEGIDIPLGLDKHRLERMHREAIIRVRMHHIMRILTIQSIEPLEIRSVAVTPGLILNVDLG